MSMVIRTSEYMHRIVPIALVTVIAVISIIGIKSAQSKAEACEYVAQEMALVVVGLNEANGRLTQIMQVDKSAYLGGEDNPSVRVNMAFVNDIYNDTQERLDAVHASTAFDQCGDLKKG